jgi:hypothetical protein
VIPLLAGDGPPVVLGGPRGRDSVRVAAGAETQEKRTMRPCAAIVVPPGSTRETQSGPDRTLLRDCHVKGLTRCTPDIAVVN